MGYDNEGFASGEPGESGHNNNMKSMKSADENVVRRMDLDEGQLRSEKRRIMKNVVVISFAFLLLFTAFQSMAALQSSINKVDGLGTSSLSVIYAALVLSCMFLPSFVIKKLTAKWAMVLSMLCYSTYIGAQFYPEFYTLIPGAIILGMGAAPMWSAKCTYLTQIGNKYAELEGVTVEPIIVRFFGIFFLFFQFSSVVGNAISSAVFHQDAKEIDVDKVEGECGTNYCPWSESTVKNSTSSSEEEAVSSSSLYILAGIYLACSLASAAVVALFVDPLTRYGEQERDDGGEKLAGKQLFVATFKHMAKTYQILIIPLTFWSGVEQGFFSADFTAGYVSCAYGVQNVGFVLMAYGATDALCSFSFGFVIKHVGRVPIFIFGMLVNGIVIIVLFAWTPHPDQAYLFYILAALWGMADAVWQTQINALYGVLFEKAEEAAFSNYRLWESLGFIFAYVLQTQVCIFSKLWVLIGVLVIGMTGYILIEFMEWKKRPTSNGNMD